jgi:diguanylate cyclase (GGDEF)-like protein/PAS domain S-box-containing protein
MIRGRLAAALFLLGVLAMGVTVATVIDAYRWLTHTSDVRMVIGRSLGESCPSLASDVGEFGRLTLDNLSQQARFGEMQNLLVRACGGDRAAEAALRSTLSAADGEERQLLVGRRTRLETTAAVCVGVFALAVGLALAFAVSATRARQRLVDNLRESEERFRLLAESATDLIRVHEPNGKTTYVTPSCERLLGHTQQEILAVPPAGLDHPDERERVLQYIAAVAKREAPPSITHRFRLKDGSYRWFETHTQPVFEGDSLARYYTSSRDIHERLEAEQKLATVAVTDELTGLHNRRGFTMLAGHEHRLAIRQGRGLLVVYADLDGLKTINDVQGHERGDAALCDFAAVLRTTFRASDIVARLGGDEYAVLAFDVAESDHAAVERRIHASIEAFNAGARRPYRIAASVGSATLSPGATRALDDLLAEADQRMYERKRARRGHGDARS